MLMGIELMVAELVRCSVVVSLGRGGLWGGECKEQRCTRGRRLPPPEGRGGHGRWWCSWGSHRILILVTV